MVSTFGNSIVSAFTGGLPVKAIYTHGVYVWPIKYYISWTPSDLSGTFSIEGQTYNLEDYSGYFDGFNGVIDVQAFMSTGVQTIETNAFSINERAFKNCYSLVSISMSQCNTINGGAFANCSTLEDVYAPECVSVGEEAFWACNSLSAVSLSLCEEVYRGAFGSCDILQTVYLPEVTYLDSHVFRSCGSLETVTVSQLSRIEGATFLWCSYLQNIDLGECSYVGVTAFYGCRRLSDVYTPLLESIDDFGFAACRSFTSMDLPVCSIIGDRAFYQCESLSTIFLGYSDVCILGSSKDYGEQSSTYRNFDETLIASGLGSIYVPSSLVSLYKSNSGWRSLSSYIHPIPHN